MKEMHTETRAQNMGVGRSGYILQLPEKGYSEIWNRSGKEKSLIIKINTVVFLLEFFEKQLFDIMFKCINIWTKFYFIR